MVVGKTFPSISKAEIFSCLSEMEVLSSVFPEITSLPTVMSSPLRTDNHPSFSIYLSDNGHVRFKDFANGDTGSLLDLLCKYWNCTFNQCLDKLGGMLIGNRNVSIRPRQIKTFTRKECDHLTQIQVVVRPWRDYDYEYWASYGISRKWLHYADIYPISYKIVTKRKSPKDKGNRYIFPADKYAYVFTEKKEEQLSIKIYQPFNERGFKWCSRMDRSVISLWTKVPEYGDRIVICSSLKDSLCLSCNCGIPAICPQGEAYSISDTAIQELKRRYRRVFICYDTDKAGREDAIRLADRTGFINVVPDLRECKDLSDSYKKYGKEWFIENIKPLFN